MDTAPDARGPRVLRWGRTSVRGVLDRLLKSWAARSLQIGALATLVDVCVLLVVVRVFHLPKPLGAAAGVAVGSTLTFFLNRLFAFRDRHSPVGPQALRFALSTLVAMGIHAELVHVLADQLDVDVVVAKLVADVLVFSVGQLLVLRFLVFRKSPPTSGAAPRTGAEG